MPEQFSPRILVVDDDASVADILSLAMPEYEVRLVADAESALAAAREFQPDLFILDLVLPGMRGTSLALLLRDSEEFAETPVFLLSGHIEPITPDGEPVRVNGLTAFSKPFQVGVVRKHIALHLAGAEGGRAAVERLQPGYISGD
jgi:two-component system OmpR family response regulator